MKRAEKMSQREIVLRRQAWRLEFKSIPPTENKQKNGILITPDRHIPQVSLSVNLYKTRSSVQILSARSTVGMIEWDSQHDPWVFVLILSKPHDHICIYYTDSNITQTIRKYFEVKYFNILSKEKNYYEWR